MKPNKLHKLTSPSNEMPGDVFDSLMESAKLEHGSDTDYYFKSKHGNYEILFGTDGNTMSIDIFGFKHNKCWIEYEPTDLQINAMKRKIEGVEIHHELESLPYIDTMWQNGHKPEDFYLLWRILNTFFATIIFRQ